MELFILSLTFLLTAVAVAFYVLPKFAPVILVSGSAIVLAIALYFHLSKFGVSEYERGTWYHNLRKYVSYVMIAAVMLGAYGFYAMNNAGSSSPIPSITTPAMPAISMPTVGGGLDSVMRTASSRIGELMRKGRISTD